MTYSGEFIYKNTLVMYTAFLSDGGKDDRVLDLTFDIDDEMDNSDYEKAEELAIRNAWKNN